jgi:uncharacterized protein (TIGR02246 family)
MPPSETDDEIRIGELIERWSRAVCERDMETVRAVHDPDVLMFDVPPPFRSRGLEAYMATWDVFYAWSAKPVAFDFDDIEIVAGQDVAFATATGRCGGTDANGGTALLEFRLTMGFRKEEGGWKIVHEHHSVPASD